MSDPLGATPGLELFESYEQDYEQLSDSISKLLAADVSRQSLGRVERELDEADEIISQMEIEARTVARELRPRLDIKLRSFRTSVAGHRVTLKDARARVDRAELLPHTALDMGSAEGSRSSSPSAQREDAARTRLLSGTDKLMDGQRRLEESHRTALETEDVGAGILRNLADQRNVLERTRDTLFEADGGIDRASNTLRKMIRRAWQQKAVTYAIIAILVLLILYVLWSKLFG